MAFSLPATVDGPERFHGGPKCPDHHSGTRSGINDWCCCCNPCLYERPPIELNDTHCCRCVPIAICATFTPDEGEDGCCRPLTQTIFVEHISDGYSRYVGGFNGADFEFRLGKYEGVGCGWRLISDELSLDEFVAIDHLTVNCLDAPPFVVDSFTNSSGCTGTISFGPYIGDKVPFALRDLSAFDDPTDVAIEDSPCSCTTAAKVLCLTGRRHVGGPIESVEFAWDADFGDRWHYLPPCGDTDTERELIFLRGDVDGNCYLEFDFEQTGPWTNDWADPPNTLGYDVHEVRDGMVAVDSCGCGLRAYSETTGGRFVTVQAGPCGRWKHKCASCRCSPHSLCVIGEIDDVFFQERLTWDGEAWAYDSTTGDFPTSFRLVLTEDECGDCVAVCDTEFAVTFAASTVLSCGTFVQFEMESIHDDYHPERFNWLWAQSGVCGCNPSICALCSEERCGGAPETLYVELQGRSLVDPLIDPSQPYDIFCDRTVAVHYWQRWSNGVPKTIACGYIGYANIVCATTTYRLRIEIAEFGAKLRVSRLNLTTGATTTDGLDNTAVAPMYCDPYYYDRDWAPNSSNETPADICFWGCVQVRQVKVTITE